jgi:hypothetical protein
VTDRERIDLRDVVDGLNCALDHVIETQIAEEEGWRQEAFIDALRELKRLRDTFAEALKDEITSSDVQPKTAMNEFKPDGAR